MARIKKQVKGQKSAKAVEAAAVSDLSGNDNYVDAIFRVSGLNPTSTTAPQVPVPTPASTEMAAFRAGERFNESDVMSVGRTDRFGRSVKVYNEGPLAGTIVGSDGELYVPPATEEAVVPLPKETTPAKPKGIAGVVTESLIDMDAFESVRSQLKLWGLEELESIVREWMEKGVGENVALATLRDNKVYKDRFYGNTLRLNSGRNALDESTYLSIENDYSEWAQYYGIDSYFGADRKQRQKKFSELIGNDISATEFKDRIDAVVTRVERANPRIKRTLREFYNINDTDLVGYFLNPKENVKILEEKVTTAEIGSAAFEQGLVGSRARAEELARLGIDRAEAVRGYSEIAADLPTAEKLSQIYSEEGIDYTQRTGEEEEFQKLASAKRAKEKLKMREISQFAGGTRGVLGGGAAGLI